MAKEFEEDDDEFFNSSGKTLPDYQNFRNLLFTTFEEMAYTNVEWRTCKQTEYEIYKKRFINTFLKFYIQIKDKSKLSHLDKKERTYLKYYYIHTNKLTVKKSINIVDISRKLMTEYGVFNLEDSGSDELW